MLELLPEISRDYGRRHLDLQSALTKCWTIYTAINCWHLNSHESAAMWVLYLKSNEGIAVQSTYRKLLDSLVDEREIFIGKVNYIDYDNEIFLDRNALAPLVYKRKSFEHEREVRAIITNWPKEPIGPDSPTATIRSGIEVDVDLKVLIENI